MKNDQNNQQIQQKVQQQVLHQSFSVSSPLPPPEWLDKYKEINPDIINELLEQYKINSEHVRGLDKKQLELVKTSQNQAFIFSIFCIILAAITAYFNHEIVASTMVGTCILGTIKALIKK